MVRKYTLKLIAILDFSKTENTLKLYPIYSDNKVTDYNPRFLTNEEFKKAVKSINAKIPSKSDNFANYFEIKL